MRPEARPAPRRSDHTSSIHYVSEDAGLDRPGEHRTRCGEDQGADGHLLSADNTGEPLQILVAAVCACTDEDLVEACPGDLFGLPDGVHPVGDGDERDDIIEIDIESLFVAAFLRHLR